MHLTRASKNNSNTKLLKSLLKKQKEREDQKLFVTEGIQITLEAVASDLMPKVLFVGSSFVEEFSSLINTDLAGTVCLELFDDDLRSILTTKNPVPVAGIFDLPKSKIYQIEALNFDTSVALIDVQDPGNVGTILRTCEATGVDMVLAVGRTCDFYNPKVLRASAGSLFRTLHCKMSAKEFRDLAATSSQPIFASTLNSNAKSIWDSSLKTGLFLLGNEAHGLDDEDAQAADHAISIPMEGKNNSLNVAVAGAVILYESLRQRELFNTK